MMGPVHVQNHLTCYLLTCNLPLLGEQNGMTTWTGFHVHGYFSKYIDILHVDLPIQAWSVTQCTRTRADLPSVCQTGYRTPVCKLATVNEITTKWKKDWRWKDVLLDKNSPRHKWLRGLGQKQKNNDRKGAAHRRFTWATSVFNFLQVICYGLDGIWLPWEQTPLGDGWTKRENNRNTFKSRVNKITTQQSLQENLFREFFLYLRAQTTYIYALYQT